MLKELSDRLKKKGILRRSKRKEKERIAEIYRNITVEEENIQDMYRQIGKLYREYGDNIEDERLTPFFNSILESLKKIEDYKMQIKGRDH